MGEMSIGDLLLLLADEIKQRIEHKYLIVFAYLLAKRVFVATPHEGASELAAFVAELLRHNGHPRAIQNVAIDRAAPILKA